MNKEMRQDLIQHEINWITESIKKGKQVLTEDELKIIEAKFAKCCDNDDLIGLINIASYMTPIRNTVTFYEEQQITVRSKK